MNRVVVTGVGPVSSVGSGRRTFEAALRAGRSGARPIRSFDTTGFPHVYGGEVQGFVPGRWLHRLDPAAWGRSGLLAAAAARLALTDAGLDPRRVPDSGSVIGTTSGESQVLEELTAEIVHEGVEAMSPALLRKLPAERLAAAVNTELGLSGEATTVATACSASNYAIGYAYDVLRAGDSDVMLAGGADSVCRWAHAGFFRLGALAKRQVSPFDRDRSGILTAEGAAVLVLETLNHARSRGARIYAEVLGYAANCDASHPVAPNAESVARCMRLALTNSSVPPASVDYICAHGTGTPANDAVEVSAIHEVFGEHPPPTSSIKSMLGHAMGAASGFGAIACVLAIVGGFLPPTINWSTRDPALGWLDVIPNTARKATVRIAQNNGFAFGGNNAITMFGAPR